MKRTLARQINFSTMGRAQDRRNWSVQVRSKRDALRLAGVALGTSQAFLLKLRLRALCDGNVRVLSCAHTHIAHVLMYVPTCAVKFAILQDCSLMFSYLFLRPCIIKKRYIRPTERAQPLLVKIKKLGCTNWLSCYFYFLRSV